MIKLMLLILGGLFLLAIPFLLIFAVRHVRKIRAAKARKEIEEEMEWMERVLQKKADLVSPDDKTP
jgi:Na+-transporting methylmalonyl-CoA/oxaloacetate decarboxylase gamma subunit